MKKLALFALTPLLASPAAAGESSPLIYDCAWVHERVRINFSKFIATYAGTDNKLDVGDISFGFPAPWGRYIGFDVLPSHDDIWEKQPETFSGTALSGFRGVAGLAIHTPVTCSIVR